MDLFIRIVDGEPFEHPIFGENFRDAFPDVDVNNLPPEFARFERVAPPPFGPYEKSRSVSYQWVDGIVKDVWTTVEMNEQEKLEKQDFVKSMWAENGFASWAFNEDTCSFEPPVPLPDDGRVYDWSEELLTWVPVPEETSSSPAA